MDIKKDKKGMVVVQGAEINVFWTLSAERRRARVRRPTVEGVEEWVRKTPS